MTSISSAASENVVQLNHGNSISDMSDHGDMESRFVYSEEEVKDTLETSAFTGKFWHDWEKLKSMLSHHLKQVLSEYPEAKMTIEQQTSLLGETFQELVKRLDNALRSFGDGPPFTLQRLCEILLSARNIYPKLSKLSLALEKNLLVTSTLTISSDPYPLATGPNSNGAYEGSRNTLENGVGPAIGDRDDIMTEVEEAEADEEMPVDMETIEDVRSSEESSSPVVES